MNDRIHINKVLSDLRDGRQLLLKYVKGTGHTRRGVLREFSVIHGIAYEAFKQRKAVEDLMPKNPSRKYALRGLIPVVNVNTKEQHTLKIYNIIGCEGLKVIH